MVGAGMSAFMHVPWCERFRLGVCEYERVSGMRSRVTGVHAACACLCADRSTIIFESVTMQFKKQLIDLMYRINAAQPHFVRCINPNAEKVPGVLSPEMILDQLRCSGSCKLGCVRACGARRPILAAILLIT